ncbi:carbohydrate kinase [Lottiidibacillus patelloidae]|uniref:Carbohydrate kinase n=1 Tax=Lottiidibacillus patelloidae TaxID=2670334 RepID=A0A263BYB2_9BACI|nr:carbohydrate kinase [Lottiidibacillus patelloidae]OZM58660.1 carbohydrate kinase [Lottiidibacillus patelloidae]
MFDVVALGEILIDFTPHGNSKNGGHLFEQNPGGAPANVLAALSKQNYKTAFIGKVGQDEFGDFLKQTLDNSNIDSKALIMTKEANTTLAFVHLENNGERSFSFYRNPGADMMLRKDEINKTIIEKTKIFHFGSISMTHEPVASATIAALKVAKENNVIISFDPNLRPALWSNLEHAKKMIQTGLTYTDIVKVSEEELQFLTGTTDLSNGTEKIIKEFDITFLCVTLGEKGCFYRYKGTEGSVNGFEVSVKDTTGAGDAFLGGLLAQILSCLDEGIGLSELNESKLIDIVTFANAVGALSTTKMGAIPSMPTLEEINKLIKKGTY